MDSSLKLNRNQLKYVLITAMLIDHIAFAFVPTFSILGQSLHIIGRLTGPSMAVLLAEGYQYTKSKGKYALRLFIFALISWIPYSLQEYGSWPFIGQGVIYSLFIAFLVIWMWDKAKIAKPLKYLLVVLGCILSLIGDWAFFVVLWALFSYIFRDDPKRKWISFSIIAVFEVGMAMLMSHLNSEHGAMQQFFQVGVVLVPILLIFFYNGKKGSKAPIHKWFFYIFYPAHMLIIFLLKRYVIG